MRWPEGPTRRAVLVGGFLAALLVPAWALAAPASVSSDLAALLTALHDQLTPGAAAPARAPGYDFAGKASAEVLSDVGARLKALRTREDAETAAPSDKAALTARLDRLAALVTSLADSERARPGSVPLSVLARLGDDARNPAAPAGLAPLERFAKDVRGGKVPPA
ncbi:MAG: hypothetical protein KGL53_15690, partial [Elusimicrobia bacterium]|nr:hypothetical protein [Elusimicrobiota bacterium]